MELVLRQLESRPLDLKQFLTVFTFRHWIIAVLNAGLTSFLGLGLIRGAERLGWPALSTLSRLRLQRLVVLVALGKGAFYLLRGTAVRSLRGRPFEFGIQLPDPYQWAGLMPMTATNIWHPTTATAAVTAVLVAMAMASFCKRIWRIAAAQRQLQAYVLMNRLPLDPRVPDLLARAANALQINSKTRLPQVLMVTLRNHTPILLGVRRPWLLLTPAVAAVLTDLEMEMMFRHELAHYRRRDHWWRWLQTWTVDISCVNGLSYFLGAQAIQIEELICDCMAIRTPDEARAMGRAIDKVQRFILDAATAGSGKLNYVQMDAALPDAVVPALMGGQAGLWRGPDLLPQRLAALIKYANEFSGTSQSSSETQVSAASEAPVSPQQSRFLHPSLRARLFLNHLWQWTGGIGLGLFMFLILYAKFQAVFGHF